MGDRGRLVIPQDVRERLGFAAGTPLILLEAADGLTLLTREKLLARVRAEFAGGPSLVDELIADRRAEAQREVTVFDASALLAFVNAEPGADVVQSRLEIGGSCGTVNWAEVAQKSIVRGSWPATRILLLSYDLRLEPVTMADAESAASRWNRADGMSLGDRLCLSLGDRLDDEVLTADRSWGSDGRIVSIR